MLADLFGGDVRPGGQDRGEEAHQTVHDHRCDGSSDHKGADGHPHDFSRPPAALHVGHGAGDGREDHGHHNTEHEIDKHRAQRLEHRGLGPQPAHDAAQDHGAQHDRQEGVVLRHGFFVEIAVHYFHSS